ncbi:hypothetical protein CEF21_10475 [Bacillus sp. FJAT-42376]|uniref:bifunctional adenosylcobinamide kinase/adenosylcobinamide-phosphate guanylyltransferase n=1 Tax=Bacillus sp. FJAT-42376 TaxID=2014076 RepID=UPI000F4E5FAB|nr:bifunctional adenosylcobinamide kinase/adenosylcobinamide-phosphate guanylyltransferase [Bacillus sp. FJAT-42376]AZB42682.1 hypothetical protein CEF21_10475 [Bacillus sp. FJAT-42376]
MHFVSGGAFNGKAKWVRKQSWWSEEALWISAYRNDELHQPFRTLTVIEGLEEFIRRDLMEAGQQTADTWRCLIRYWQEWEEAAEENNLVLIGTDISKGIVPAEAENRLWRDVTGWVYQDIVQHAKRADFIWYGIQTPLKGAGK